MTWISINHFKKYFSSNLCPEVFHWHKFFWFITLYTITICWRMASIWSVFIKCEEFDLYICTYYIKAKIFPEELCITKWYAFANMPIVWDLWDSHKLRTGGYSFSFSPFFSLFSFVSLYWYVLKFHVNFSFLWCCELENLLQYSVAWHSGLRIYFFFG